MSALNVAFWIIVPFGIILHYHMLQVEFVKVAGKNVI